MKYTIGDKVKVKTKDKSYTGVVMPTPELADKDVLILKLANGYNIGIRITKDTQIKKIGEVKLKGLPEYKPKINPKLPNVSVISTGGTITSRVDYKTGAVYPLEKPEELLLSIPELIDIINIRQIKQPFTLLSEDMAPKQWQKIAEEAAILLNSDDVGLIITHGTDTLHYTAAALSFMLKNVSKPIALVGGQRSSDRGSFDGALNLICAAHYCKSDLAGVSVVMHGESSDTFCYAHRGTKVRKLHTSVRNAFHTVNDIPLAKIFKDGKIKILNKNHKQRFDHHAETILDNKFEPKTALVKYHPGANPDILNHYIKNKYKGIVIEATGLGHVATQPIDKKDSWLPVIKKAVDKGIAVCFTPQTLYGRLQPHVYRTARLLQKAGVIYLQDMLPETAYVKLGWVLGHTTKPDEVKKKMLTNIAGEINPKLQPNSVLK
ncbi:Glu-tRNA(Gln) amidotransferase subunit GatD [Candidatus Woesearchaeota archaeon]|nr:Glu-tRNA(Gln) amidotransferase subunit GatD [Candidatus Woesearchaeota archaeon]